MVDGDDGSQDRRPIPDPTVLTTEALNREIAALRREMGLEVAAHRREVDQELKLRRLVTDEQFNNVDLQFTLVERQRVEQKEDGRAALNAALAASKEAVDKNEKATAEQLKQQGSQFGTELAALRGSHDDLKDRVTKLESFAGGGQAKAADLRAVILVGFTVLAFVLGVVVFIANLITAAP